MLKPMDDRIFVEDIEEAKEDSLAVILKNPTQLMGRIVAVGPGLKHREGHHPMTLKVGDKIIFGPDRNGFKLWLDIEVDGRKLKMMRERDVKAKITK